MCSSDLQMFSIGYAVLYMIWHFYACLMRHRGAKGVFLMRLNILIVYLNFECHSSGLSLSSGDLIFRIIMLKALSLLWLLIDVIQESLRTITLS